MPTPLCLFPPIGDKVQHLREHDQGRRIVSAEARVAQPSAQCRAWCGQSGWTLWRRPFCKHRLEGGNPMCNVQPRDSHDVIKRKGCTRGYTTIIYRDSTRLTRDARHAGTPPRARCGSDLLKAYM
eukprot:scaffold88097_cov93-Phaeocystis_antarctica.AAC.2